MKYAWIEELKAKRDEERACLQKLEEKRIAAIEQVVKMRVEAQLGAFLLECGFPSSSFAVVFSFTNVGQYTVELIAFDRVALFHLSEAGELDFVDPRRTSQTPEEFARKYCGILPTTPKMVGLNMGNRNIQVHSAKPFAALEIYEFMTTESGD